MTNKEARDEIAQIVKNVSTKWGGPAMREFENDPPIRKHFAIADALLAAGYRKHPEPEITAEMVERAEYVVCGEDYPWIELEDGVMLRALEAALRVPVSAEVSGKGE